MGGYGTALCGEGGGKCVCLLSPYPVLLAARSCPVLQRYFVLEDGILQYATTRQDVSQVPGWGVGEVCPRT